VYIGPTTVPVPGFEGALACIDGNIYSIRGTTGGRGRRWHKSGFCKLKGCICVSKKGSAYLHVAVKCNITGKAKTKRIHTLIALAFYGSRPTGYVVDHVDRDPFNNKLSNLRYVTYEENSANKSEQKKERCRASGLAQYGGNNGRSKVTSAQVADFRAAIETLRIAGERRITISRVATGWARSVGLSTQQVRNIIKGKTWKTG
jgi:hypothetical protein